MAYIQWRNEERMEFELVKPNMVAALWGEYKHKKKMTYEKLSRAIRYYYKTGKIEKIPDRRLQYRFIQ